MVKNYCDKCKQEKQTKDLVVVRLTVGTVGGMYTNGDYANIEICTDCLNNMGVKAKEYNHASLENKRETDKLYELIQNIVHDCLSNQ